MHYTPLLLHTLHDVHRTRIATSQATHHCMRKGFDRVASQGVPGSREAAPKLATFSEAILPRDWPLGFLAAPVLEEGCVPPPFAWPALKLRSPPVLTTVLRHAQHLSRDAGQSVLAGWPAQAMPPEAACGKVLEYLHSQASLLSSPP